MNRKLYCSPNKKICGVCGGFADYFNIDPTIIRVIVAVVAIYVAVIPVLIAYFIIALVMPKPPENYYQLFNNTSKKITKGHDKKLAGVCSAVAERFDFDPTIVRIIFVLCVLLLGAGVLAYIAAAIIMPPCSDYTQQYGTYQNPNGYYDPNNQYNNYNAQQNYNNFNAQQNPNQNQSTQNFNNQQ